MKKCIYLKKTEPEVTFKSEEHIIPAGIGGIRKLNNGMVSDQFNTGIFSSIELDFMRNSIVALPRQFQGPGKRGALTEKKATKSNIHIMSKSDEFDDVSLGYIKLGKPHQIPQLKITNQSNIQIIFDQYDGDYTNQLVKFIEVLKTFNGRYNTLVESNIPMNQILLGNYKGKWYLGIRDEQTIPPLVDIISKLINNTSILSEQPKYDKVQVISCQHMEFDMEKFYRVCAKIAFNFLASSHGSDFVLNEQFDPIRNWIVNGGDNKFINLINKDKKIFEYNLFPDEAHKIFITKDQNSLMGLLSLYGGVFEISILLCDNFSESFYIDGYICDWMNKKEYTLIEYLKTLNYEKYL
ncbi:HNH endonuclease [Clostridium sporogenes]|uniref:HNH endonuclease n=1 Tax=Clostridium sporogenes TaxID=1509 RepID=UPI002238E230|nr:HNH endonuclease [Clostridium sporogenes]MCW6079680.1 HNH endonuclease [Clostridium sporogenes]